MKLEIYKEIKSHPSLNKWSDVQEIFSRHAIRSKCIPLFCHLENMMAVKLRNVHCINSTFNYMILRIT